MELQYPQDWCLRLGGLSHLSVISVHSVVQLGFVAEERGFLQSTNSGLTLAARLVKTSVSATANALQR